MHKDTIKNYLTISFVVVELLSMLFNYYFVTLNIGTFEYHFNFSVVFFCFGFFIVDVIADQFSPSEANKFIFYKLYSQMLFLIFGQIAIGVYGLEGTQLAHALNKSPWMVFSGLLATYAGFNTMSAIMSHMKIGVYQGSSVFKRYLYSTIPGELLFSFVFTLLCFYTNTSFDELMHVFVTSAIAKLILSVLFASIMEILIKLRLSPKDMETTPIKIEVN